MGLADAQRILHINAPELTIAISLEQHSDLVVSEASMDVNHGFLRREFEESAMLTVPENSKGALSSTLDDIGRTKV